jgi:hypothetical protein
MRVAHFIRGNKSKAYPTRIILFDTETQATPIGPYAQRHELRLGVACYWHRRGENEPDTFDWITFRDPGSFWDWVLAHSYQKTRLVLASHNLGFDLPILRAFVELPSRGFKLRAFYSKGMTTLIRFRGHKCTLELVDNTNFFAGRLADLGEIVGIPKGNVDFDHVEDADLELYCHRDVEILLRLWQVWLQFIHEHDLGQWYRTLPSQAFGAFRHRFLDKPILIHDHEEALKLEREAYHGGRTEVLRVGRYQDGPYYKLDVNSMYPWAMREYSYPVALRGYKTAPTVPYLRKKLEKYHVVAEVEITTEDPAFQVHLDGHACYPVGKFWTVLTTEELRLVLRRGQIHAVNRLAFYSGAPIFRSYVDYFYPLKVKYTQEGNAPFRTISKGFLNFLYGKFGQRGIQDKLLGECPLGEFRIMECVEYETNKQYDLIYIGGQVIRREKKDESYNSFPAIAAEVTANARLYLWRLVSRAGRESVYYIDTDSLIVNREGMDRLTEVRDLTRLGALKLEGTASTLEIRAPKDYTFGGYTKIKGIRPNAEKLAPATFRQDKFPSIQGLLRSGEASDYVVTQQVKTLNRQVYSGVVTPSGFVRPFQLGLPLHVPF